MFEPARFPAPPLSGLGKAWRYVLAGLGYLLFLSALIATRDFDPSLTGTDTDGIVVYPDLPAGMADWPTWLLVVDGLLGLVAFALIRLRRRFPLGVYMTFVTASLVSNSISVVMTWAFLSLCSRRNLPRIGLALGYSAILGVLGSVFLPWQARTYEPFAPLGAFGVAVPHLSSLLTMSVMALIGMYYGTRQDRAAGVQDRIDNADRDRELAVLGERNRIAREMHDVLAHRISLVSMHAGALAFRPDLPPEKTREIAQIIQENAHASLTELRSVLSTLRDGQLDAVGAPAAPQPTLADLPALIGQARSLGQRVNVNQGLEWDAVPAVTARHAYRMVQECLTNARKHAPNAVVEVAVAGSPATGISLRVANPLAPGPRSVPGAGLGLVGLRERVNMLGGRLWVGPRDGYFIVESWLPWPAATP